MIENQTKESKHSCPYCNATLDLLQDYHYGKMYYNRGRNEVVVFHKNNSSIELKVFTEKKSININKDRINELITFLETYMKEGE